jgi:hypothetical protein
MGSGESSERIRNVSRPNSVTVPADVVVVVVVSFTAVWANVTEAVVSKSPKKAALVSVRLFCFIAW